MSIQGVPLDLGAMTTTARDVVPVEGRFVEKSMAAVASVSRTSDIPPAQLLLVPTTVTEEPRAPTAPEEAGSVPSPEMGQVIVGEGKLPGEIPAKLPGVVPLAYEAAERRPDFVYRPGRLEFQMQATYEHSQSGLAVGPGVRPGTTRFVPVGNF